MKMSEELTQQYVSACPLNCWDACSFSVTVKNGQVTKIDGNKNHPITNGKICARGRMLEKRANDKERIVYPMKKINGEWRRIRWEQALDEISSKLIEVRNQFGPKSVLHSHDYANSGLLKNIDERFFRLYGGFTKLEGSLCWAAGIEAQKRDFGNSVSHAPEDIKNSRHIVVWGRNVLRTNMHLYPYLLEAKKRGSTITVINPIKNELEKIATEYIQIPPGHDGFLATGIMKIILANNWEDRAFIEQNTHGFSTLDQLLSSVSMEEIIEKTNMNEETLEKLAKIYSDRPTATFLGLGMQRYRDGGNTIRLIDALGAISGNIGIRGGGVNYAHLPVGQSFDIDELTLAKKKAEIRTFTRMNQGEKILQENEPPITFMFIARSNLLTQVPNANVTRQALQKVETIVVMDQFMTDTAQMAHYFLPVTTAFEEEDIYFSSMFHSFINYGPKIVEARGEAKTELWIWTELAKRLGFGEYFQYNTDEWLQIGTKSLKEQGFSLQQLKQQGFYKLPIQDVPWETKKFQTETGKFEFYSLKGAKEGGDPLLRKPLEKRAGHTNHRYTLLSIHPLRSNHSQHYPYIHPGKENVIEVSMEIATTHGLKDGDSVRLWNEQGELKGTVRINDKLQKDTINVDEGRWSKFGGTVNVLTKNGESDMGKGSILYDCYVSIAKI